MFQKYKKHILAFVLGLMLGAIAYSYYPSCNVLHLPEIEFRPVEKKTDEIGQICPFNSPDYAKDIPQIDTDNPVKGHPERIVIPVYVVYGNQDDKVEPDVSFTMNDIQYFNVIQSKITLKIKDTKKVIQPYKLQEIREDEALENKTFSYLDRKTALTFFVLPGEAPPYVPMPEKVTEFQFPRYNRIFISEKSKPGTIAHSLADWLGVAHSQNEKTCNNQYIPFGCVYEKDTPNQMYSFAIHSRPFVIENLST